MTIAPLTNSWVLPSQQMSGSKRNLVVSFLIHTLPYILLSFFVIRIGFFIGFGQLVSIVKTFAPMASCIIFGGITVLISGMIAGMIAIMISGMIAGWVASGIAFGIASGTVLVIVVGIAFGIAFGIAYGIALGLFLGLFLGIVLGIVFVIIVSMFARDVFQQFAVGIVVGMVGGIIGGIALGSAIGIALGSAIGIALVSGIGIALGLFLGLSALSSAFGIDFWMASRIDLWIALAVGIAVGIAGGVIEGPVGGIAVGIVLTTSLLRAYYYPIHVAFLWFRPLRRRYGLHPVAWDDLCSLCFVGLHEILVLNAEIFPEIGHQEIEDLISSCPSQRIEGLKAKTILIARASARDLHLSHINQALAKLPEGRKGFLAEIRKLREMVEKISQLQGRLDTMQRPAFREPTAAQLVEVIENFSHQITGFHEPLAAEFRKAAESWQALAREQLLEIQHVVSNEPVPQVFRAGDPIDRSTEAFVLRMPPIENLESQIMLATGCPGLLIYGRRRMGKSTLLRNLTGFLPESLIVKVISMQAPQAFESLQSWARLVAENARKDITTIDPASPPVTLVDLFQTLEQVNQELHEQGQRLLLAFDEFEMIDQKIAEGVFKLDLLNLVRESVQTHRRIIWAFAGSHDLSELSLDRWSSYFVSLRTINVGPFEDSETRLLLTKPMCHSPLWQNRQEEMPSFNEAFWGENGIVRIQTETGGWPHLVQLVAETAVDFANDRGARHLTGALLEETFDRVIERGDTVFYELLVRENRFPGEWEYLLKFRQQETQLLPEDDTVRRSLRRRLLVVEHDGAWRLRVPLMRRWLINHA